jgi:hypothetical protein
VTVKSKEQLRSQKLSLTLQELKEERKGKKLVDKKSIIMHTKDAAGSTADSSFSATPMAPTEDELTLINQYTRSPKTAEEVVVIPTLSCNTIPDRDDDYFDKETVQGFSKLPDPYGPNGKSFMVGHDYTNLPVGRIFDTNTKTIEGEEFLTNKVYIPNTDQYKSFIENVDFGINWAVSVGVMLEAQLCSICQEPQYSSWFFGGVCETGHIKSAYYDPAEERTDDWGLIIESTPDDPKAVKALGNMHGAKDFYELSQVFLGAQFFAAVDKQADGVMKGVLKSARKATIPILGLGRQEAEKLPMQHVSEKLVAALEKFNVKRTADGTASWTDDQGLVWNYAPGDEVMCLGKSASEDSHSFDDNGSGKCSVCDDEAEAQVHTDAADEDSDTTKEESDGEGQDDSGGSGEAGSDPELEGTDDGGAGDDGDDPDDLGSEDGDSEVGEDGDLTDDDEEDDSDSEDGEEEEMSKQVVLAAARKVKAPTIMLDAINEDSEGNGLEAVLRFAANAIKSKDESIAALTPKAAMGDQYMAQLRADAVDWYVKSHSLNGEKGVATETFEKILDACGENVELIKALRDENKNQAKGAAPRVRRSSFPADPHDKHQAATGTDGSNNDITPGGIKSISRIHG